MTYEECKAILERNAKAREQINTMRKEIKTTLTSAGSPVACLVASFIKAEEEGSLPVRFHIGKYAYGPTTVANLRKKGLRVVKGIDCWEIVGRDV